MLSAMANFGELYTRFGTLNIHGDVAPSGVTSNLLSIALNDLLKYFRYAHMRLSDIAVNAPAYVAATQANLELAKSFPEGSHQQTPEEAKAWSRLIDAQDEVSIEVEGFIICTTMMLDRVAAFTEQFFGSASSEWKTFNSFKYFAPYAAGHNLSVPPTEFIATIDWLREHVVDFRHGYLVHKQEGLDRPRHYVSVSCNLATGEVTFGIGAVMYPTEGESPFTSVSISDVETKLYAFVDMWLDYLFANMLEPTARS
jgi:hypothetical protein